MPLLLLTPLSPLLGRENIEHPYGHRISGSEPNVDGVKKLHFFTPYEWWYTELSKELNRSTMQGKRGHIVSGRDFSDDSSAMY
jgi:hypothetical protein